MDKNNLSTVRQSFANTVFTHKVHEVASEFQGKKAFAVKIVNLVFIGLIFIFLILQALYMANPIFSYIGIGLTVGDTIFLIVQLSFNFDEKAVQHKNFALKYMGLRDKYRELITDIMNGDISRNEIRSRRNGLQTEYQVISDLAPQTGRSEYNETQKRLNKRGIVQGEDFTWSDEEIDMFLPQELILKKKYLLISPSENIKYTFISLSLFY